VFAATVPGMTTSPRARRASRALSPLVVAGALGALAAAPTSAFAADATATATPVVSGPVTATYSAAGVGYNKVLDGHAAGTVKLQVENGDIVEAFCIQYAKAIAQSGTYTAKTYAASGVKNVAKAADIAVRHNAVAGKLADQKAENAAAQLAIWSFTDGQDFSKVPNAAIVARAKALVAAAKENTEGSSSYVLTSSASVSGEGDDAKAAVVAQVKTSAGAPVAGQVVRLAVGSQTLSATTDATGKATVALDAPDAAAKAQLTMETKLAAGSVVAPVDQQLMVTTSDAKVVRKGEVTVPAEPTPTPKKVVEKPTPIPTPTETKKSDAVTPTTPTEPPAPPTASEPEPNKLPFTGGWATTGMFAGALAAAGAGFAGRRFFRRS
jgi:hypothetical protein